MQTLARAGYACGSGLAKEGLHVPCASGRGGTLVQQVYGDLVAEVATNNPYQLSIFGINISLLSSLSSSYPLNLRLPEVPYDFDKEQVLDFIGSTRLWKLTSIGR